jgi:hypothetical protein
MYIASSIKSNVRELEGALIRLAAYASLSKKRISQDEDATRAAATKANCGSCDYEPDGATTPSPGGSVSLQMSPISPFIGSYHASRLDRSRMHGPPQHRLLPTSAPARP